MINFFMRSAEISKLDFRGYHIIRWEHCNDREREVLQAKKDIPFSEGAKANAQEQEAS